MLARWEKVIGMTFYPVEIETDIVPHIYGLQQKGQSNNRSGVRCLC